MAKKRKPGRPKNAPGTVRSEIIPLRLTGAERKTLEAAAKRDGATLSEWMRARLLGADQSPGVTALVWGAVSAKPTPLSELYRRIQANGAAMSLGQFHDALRDLSASGTVALSPWTQAMYQLQDGECCLVIGAEIMGYVAASPS